MSNVNNTEDQREEGDQIVLSLLRLLMKKAAHSKFQRNSNSHEMNETSEKLQVVKV